MNGRYLKQCSFLQLSVSGFRCISKFLKTVRYYVKLHEKCHLSNVGNQSSFLCPLFHNKVMIIVRFTDFKFIRIFARKYSEDTQSVALYYIASLTILGARCQFVSS